MIIFLRNCTRHAVARRQLAFVVGGVHLHKRVSAWHSGQFVLVVMPFLFLFCATVLAPVAGVAGECKKTATGLCVDYGPCSPPRSGRCRDVRNGPDWDCQCKLTGKSEDSSEVHIGVGIDISGRHRDHHDDWNDGDHRERDRNAHTQKEDSTKQRHDRNEDGLGQGTPRN